MLAFCFLRVVFVYIHVKTLWKEGLREYIKVTDVNEYSKQIYSQSND